MPKGQNEKEKPSPSGTIVGAGAAGGSVGTLIAAFAAS